MKYLAILLAGSLAACSHDAPPAASSDSVARATDTPSNNPSFAPAAPDGLASAPNDARGSATGTAVRADASTASAIPTPASPAAATDNRASASDTHAAAETAATTGQPDNSRVNIRDRNNENLTAMDQGGGEGDRKITQQIRQAVVKDSSLSFTAKNVKIITIGGKVTLRGPVKTAEERAAIEAAAKKVAGATHVENLLEVKN